MVWMPESYRLIMWLKKWAADRPWWDLGQTVNGKGKWTMPVSHLQVSLWSVLKATLSSVKLSRLVTSPALSPWRGWGESGWEGETRKAACLATGEPEHPLPVVLSHLTGRETEDTVRFLARRRDLQLPGCISAKFEPPPADGGSHPHIGDFPVTEDPHLCSAHLAHVLHGETGAWGCSIWLCSELTYVTVVNVCLPGGLCKPPL